MTAQPPWTPDDPALRRAANLWPQQPPPEPPYRGPGDPVYPLPAYAPPPTYVAPTTRVPVAAGYTGHPGSGPGGPGARSRSRSGTIAVAAIAAVVALLVGSVGVWALVRDGDRTPTAAAASTTSTTRKRSTTTTTEQEDPGLTIPGFPTPSTAPQGGSSDPRDVEDAALEIQSFVEKERGLTYKNDVTVTPLSESEFKQRVLKEIESEPSNNRSEEQLFKATGLIPESLDLTQAEKDLAADGVLGFYDPKTKALVVRGNKVTAFLREIMAHELTHALDDQYFNLDRPDLDKAKDDSGYAFLAAVEGSAKRVENDYVGQLSASEKDEIEIEQMELGGSQTGSLDLPAVLAEIQMAPYDFGEPFVRSLFKAHGNDGVNAALSADLPKTSEQILDPSKYRGHEEAKPVDRPPADGEVIEDGTLGQLMTAYVLQEGGGESLLDKVLGSGSFDTTTGSLQFVEPIEGWGGDHYVLYHQSTSLCVRVDWKMDSQAALEDMQTALSSWAAQDKAVTIDTPSGDTLRATRCTGAVAGSGSSGGNRATPTTPTTKASAPTTTVPSTPTSGRRSGQPA